ncbi:hypothetical protein J4462_03820 [Candidatus Pacearchaeota archaeon]|nr:hypothetical protein [Candidatus Pacearchaeota archaeon]
MFKREKFRFAIYNEKGLCLIRFCSDFYSSLYTIPMIIAQKLGIVYYAIAETLK